MLDEKAGGPPPRKPGLETPAEIPRARCLHRAEPPAMLRTDMPGRTYQLLLWCLSLALGVALVRAADAPPPVAAPKKIVQVVVIPVQDEIGSPVLYILRRGLKEAIDEKADAVVLDM
jgi:hypothetical protein